MAVDTHETAPTPPSQSIHMSGRRTSDGIIVGCVMAFGAIALMIIFSLT